MGRIPFLSFFFLFFCVNNVMHSSVSSSFFPFFFSNKKSLPQEEEGGNEIMQRKIPSGAKDGIWRDTILLMANRLYHDKY